MCNIIFFALIANVEVQTNWMSGPGVLGPVDSWNSFFYRCDSVSYNIEGRILPIATRVNYSAWESHTIENNSGTAYLDALVYGDFDKDGYDDIVGARNQVQQITFYKNLGTSFSPIRAYALPQAPYGTRLSVNDINNDDLLDVISSGNGLRVFKNSGNFNFTSEVILNGSFFYCVTGDIDNDGNIDIVVSGPDARGPIYILKNNGTGQFYINQTLQYESFRLYLSDVSGDRYLDIISNEWYANQIRIYHNDGNGNFSPITSWASRLPDGLWSRDMDNDGDNDILGCECAAKVEWWQNSGNGISYTPYLVYSGSEYGDAAFSEDMDIDGKADVVSGYHKVGFFRQITWNNFTEYVIGDIGSTHWLYPFYRGKCVQTVDVIVSDYETGRFLWYKNNMINQFANHSYLESSVLNSNCDAQWKWFGYEVCCPFDSAISLQFRSGKNISEITSKPWSTPPVFLPGRGYFIDSVNIAPFTSNRDTLFQYKVNFNSRAQDAPIVYEVWVKWERSPTGVEKIDEEKVANMEIRGNKIYYSLPREAIISLSIYDISGRLVKLLESGKKSAGNYEVVVPSLATTGIYFINLYNEGYRITKKVVILH